MYRNTFNLILHVKFGLTFHSRGQVKILFVHVVTAVTTGLVKPVRGRTAAGELCGGVLGCRLGLVGRWQI